MSREREKYMNEKLFFAPSLMCMDLMDMKNQIGIINDRADYYHVDIMDGHFVPNITLSPDFVKAVSRETKLPLDCHLMVTNPIDYIDNLVNAGAGVISLHAETINSNAFRILNYIKEKGCKVGVVINPATPLSYIKHYIHMVDKITIMTVDPGFAGQKFIREMLNKIREAKAIKVEKGLEYIIEIDGSCNKNTFKELYEAGGECFVVGSSGLFNLDENLERAWEIMLMHFTEETGVKFDGR